MEPHFKVDKAGRLVYITVGIDGSISTYEVLGFKPDTSLNLKLLYRRNKTEGE